MNLFQLMTKRIRDRMCELGLHQYENFGYFLNLKVVRCKNCKFKI